MSSGNPGGGSAKNRRAFLGAGAAGAAAAVAWRPAGAAAVDPSSASPVPRPDFRFKEATLTPARTAVKVLRQEVVWLY